jgi:hypothetical protein
MQKTAPQSNFHIRKIRILGNDMARPRTPTNVLAMRGSFKHDPQRKREDAAVNGDIGTPPPYFNARESVAWQEIVDNAPIGVLSSADRQIVEVLSRLIAECRESFIDFPVQKLARIESMLGKLGMTPADRSKVSGKKQDNNRNAFADL